LYGASRLQDSFPLMKICVYGAGAVGGLIAGWLARSGQEV
jgi:tRNA A37 threonylcarbamoyladenosine dehydratase